MEVNNIQLILMIQTWWWTKNTP